MPTPTSAAEAVILDVLRGDTVTAARLSAVAESLVRTARSHGMESLLAERLRSRSDLPARLAGSLQTVAQQNAVADLVREPELRQLLATMDDAGIPAVVFKGAHLAYSVYPRPDLRPRLDTDLLIPYAALARTDTVMAGLGYQASPQVSSELAVSQKAYTKTIGGVDVHTVDVHWQLACPQAFARVLEHRELLTNAVPIGALGPSARGPNPLHAMIIACVHRIAHHRDSGQLKWLYDIHLLAPRLSSADWEALIQLSREREVSRVVMDGLIRAGVLFRGPALTPFARPEFAPPHSRERSAKFLEPRRRSAVLLDDLGRLGMRDRLQLLREHLFPSAVYMRRMYAPSSRLPLPLLYLRRILTGAMEWFRRPS